MKYATDSALMTSLSQRLVDGDRQSAALMQALVSGCNVPLHAVRQRARPL